MVIDTSAILAIFQDEPERREFDQKIEDAMQRLISAANYLETAIFIEDRFGYEGVRDLKLFVAEADIEVIPVSLEQAEIAREAYRTFGRGHHPASLNFGDCFAYSLAKMTGEPLLFKGNDFSKTDIASA